MFWCSLPQEASVVVRVVDDIEEIEYKDFGGADNADGKVLAGYIAVVLATAAMRCPANRKMVALAMLRANPARFDDAELLEGSILGDACNAGLPAPCPWVTPSAAEVRALQPLARHLEEFLAFQFSAGVLSHESKEGIEALVAELGRCQTQ